MRPFQGSLQSLQSSPNTGLRQEQRRCCRRWLSPKLLELEGAETHSRWPHHSKVCFSESETSHAGQNTACSQRSVGLELSPEISFQKTSRGSPSAKSHVFLTHGVSIAPFSRLASSSAPRQQPPGVSGILIYLCVWGGGVARGSDYLRYGLVHLFESKITGLADYCSGAGP